MDKMSGNTSEQRSNKEEIYEYKAAGIQETHGQVPGWLWLVVVVMSIWGIYYLYSYWSPSS